MKIPDILKVVYAPHKTFKETVENPSYLGPLIIIVLFIIANVAFAYVSTSTTHIAQSVPGLTSKLDEWTENSTFWTSNAQKSESSDAINGSTYVPLQYYGNTSIAFSAVNCTQIVTELENIGTVNCSRPDGYDMMSLRIKWTSPQTKPPSNITLYLFSANSSNHFYKSLEDSLSNFTYNIWNNETISLGASEGWSSSNSSVDWGSITGLKLEFTWPDTSDITLLIDGLYFYGPSESLLEVYGTGYLLNIALLVVMQFIITWVILSGLIYIITKGLRGKLVWKILMIAVGLTLITMFVQAAVNVAVYSAVPPVNCPFELIGGFRGETAADAAYNKIVEQTWLADMIRSYMQIIVHVWTIALCALALRILAGFSWTKSLLVGATAYAIMLFIGSLGLGLTLFG